MQCKDKIRYLDSNTAASALKRTKRRTIRRRSRNQLINQPKAKHEEDNRLEVYKCRICTYYHLGHRPPWMESSGTGENPAEQNLVSGSCHEILVKKRLLGVA